MKSIQKGTTYRVLNSQSQNSFAAKVRVHHTSKRDENRSRCGPLSPRSLSLPQASRWHIWFPGGVSHECTLFPHQYTPRSSATCYPQIIVTFFSKYVHFYIRYCLNLLRVNVLHIYLKTLADVPQEGRSGWGMGSYQIRLESPKD